jgi:uncharacterized protein involved in response to NO
MVSALQVIGLVTLFALANLLFHLATWRPGLEGYGERLALGVAALLIGLIGGRIVPSFTRNWLVRAGAAPLPRPFARFDKTVLVLTAIALAAWIVMPQTQLTGIGLLAAGGLHLLRLGRWRGTRAALEPIVFILHLGYLWLAVSLFLLGLAALALIEASSALHALTAGAIGTMTLAVMTRASLGHTGRKIRADGVTLAIYALVTAGALLRVAATLFPQAYLSVMAAGGIMWSAAFALFACVYAPVLLTPARQREALSR